MQLDDELHVFADAMARIAADLYDGGFTERTESSGDDEQHAHYVKPDSTGQESAQIFRGLQRNDRIFRKAYLLHLAFFNFAAAADANNAADRDAGRVAHEGVDNLDERTLFEDGVRIDGDDDGVGGNVDAGVQRVRLATVLLVQNDQFFVCGGAEDFENLFRLQRLFIRLVEGDELVGVDQQLQRLVL